MAPVPSEDVPCFSLSRLTRFTLLRDTTAGCVQGDNNDVYNVVTISGGR
jgi:hypothetical protein